MGYEYCVHASHLPSRGWWDKSIRCKSISHCARVAKRLQKKGYLIIDIEIRDFKDEKKWENHKWKDEYECECE